MKNKIIKKIISSKGELLFLHANMNGTETEFITSNDFLLQVGHLIFPKDYIAKKHRHAIVPRQIPYTAEVLLILSGRLKYSMWDYNNPNIIIAKGIARKHDILLLGKVGHSFVNLIKSKIIEIKQGPYLGKLDKEYDE